MQEAAEELARTLEKLPYPLTSLKLDHATLVAKLGALMPFLESFALSVVESLEKGKHEQAWEEIGMFSNQLVKGLSISPEDSVTLCILLVMTGLVVKHFRPMLESMESKRWEEWFQRLWGKGENQWPEKQ